jgi:hypothetical protein
LIRYFQKNIEKFERLSKTYIKDNEQILRLISEDDERNFKNIFDLIVKVWPLVVASNIIGREERLGGQ